MISLIAAADLNGAIGFDNKLLCRLKEDMQFFVSKTKGKPVVMGYKTFASLGFKPLKGRLNIVMTHSPMAMTAKHIDLLIKGDDVLFETFEYIQYMEKQSPHLEFMVIGGQQTYELFLPFAEQLYLTRISHAFPLADSHFPAISYSDWQVKMLLVGESNNQNDYAFSTFSYTRKAFPSDSPGFEKSLEEGFSFHQGNQQTHKEEQK